VRVLLDENFPLPLCKRLRAEGFEVEHIIELGLRGISDAMILARLQEEELLFLTQDKEFLEAPGRLRATILVSHVDQSRPIVDRMERWLEAIRTMTGRPLDEKIFEMFDDGIPTPSAFKSMLKGEPKPRATRGEG
jgi:hypothetical protein